MDKSRAGSTLREGYVLRGLVGQILTVVSGKVLTRGAQLVTFVVLARFLSPEEFGWYGIITTSLALATILGGLGLRQSLAFWIGQQRMTAGEAGATALVIWPLLAGAASLVLMLTIGGSVVADNTAVRIALVVSISAALIIDLLQGVNLGQGRIREFASVENLPKTLLMLGVLALAALGVASLDNVLWAHAGGLLLAVPVLGWLALRRAGRMRIRFRAIIPMVGYGVIFALNLFFLMLGARISMFIIEANFGSAAAGRFFAASRVSEILLEVATAAGMVLFANAARVDRSSPTISRNLRASCGMFWLFLVGAIAVVLAAPALVSVLAGDQYVSAGPALQVLALGLAPAAAAKLIYPTLAGSGRPYFGTPIILVSLLTNFALALLLVPEYSLVGGAIAMVVGQYVLFAGYVLLASRTFNMPVRDFILLRSDDLRAVGAGVKSGFGRFIARLRG